ncbi:uncharacterized protein EDB91DRAFT_1162518 [Suillus paluster]|uniref:uncharacterized protein n=1 Tax=Suillus paluster TaxID=48578 RepID=UPI001B85F379|nr:uncharacterized protein EDB91DRAFT_1162518 [Suillus paluster]KAG1728286.1 hypothetical protein EDB91DRAFT_1162518 [Suillus paluster]
MSSALFALRLAPSTSSLPALSVVPFTSSSGFFHETMHVIATAVRTIAKVGSMKRKQTEGNLMARRLFRNLTSVWIAVMRMQCPGNGDSAGKTRDNDSDTRW